MGMNIDTVRFRLTKNGRFVKSFGSVGIMHKFVNTERLKDPTAKFRAYWPDGSLSHDFETEENLRLIRRVVAIVERGEV